MLEESKRKQQEEVIEIEQGSKGWLDLRARSHRISATNIMRAIDIGSLFYTYLKEYRNKLEEGGESKPEFTGNEATRFGQQYEDEAIIETVEWARYNSLWKDYVSVRKVGSIYEYEKENFHLSCSPDALVFTDEEDKSQFFGIETKCPFNPNNIPYTKESIKHTYIFQCLQNLHITGAKFWLLAFYNPRLTCHNLVVYRIDRNDSLWQFMCNMSKKFFLYGIQLKQLETYPERTGWDGVLKKKSMVKWLLEKVTLINC